VSLVSTPAMAQFRGGYAFLMAVEKRDGDKATEALKDDPNVINSRHPQTGETALAIATKRRDTTWVRFLLSKGADGGIADREGVTPLMHAAMLNFTDGAQELIDRKVPIDQTNRRGETALILAIQARNANLVAMLVKNGANPDKADHVTGLSARDYAKRDDRTGSLIAALNTKSTVPVRDSGAVFGPK
jgi:ankyrin repeat protein